MSKVCTNNDMATVISYTDIKYGFGTLRLNKPESQDIANQLIVAGYRHADEVRKETAKEILNLFNRYPHEFYETLI